jgi:hypothetical protein
MINFQLRCQDDHAFEAWFRDSQACDLQAELGLVECPYCGSLKVTKKASNAAQAATAVVVAQPSPVEMDEDDCHAKARDVAQKILEAVSKLRDFAEENIDNVNTQKAASKADDINELDEEIIDIEGLPSSLRGTD